MAFRMLDRNVKYLKICSQEIRSDLVLAINVLYLTLISTKQNVGKIIQ